VDVGPWTTEYVPAKTKFFTLALYKRPYLTQNAIRSLVGKQSDQLTDGDYKEALKTLGFDERYLKDDRYAEAVRKMFRELLNQLNGYVIVGGRETVGKGIVKVKFLGEAGERR